VVIFRDEYGVAHVFADTNKALFTGFGYAVAEDRLWQLELFRHAAQGRLAELLGAAAVPTNMQIGQSTALAADVDIRTRHYTDTELQQQFSLLDAEEAEIFRSYADGINRYLNDVVAADPARSKLPFEFHYLGIGIPEPWSALDVVANAVYQTRFGQAGGQERGNQTVLVNLINRHGQADGLRIFNDLRWVDDPDTPVSVPVEGTVSNRQRGESPVLALTDQLKGASLERFVSMEDKADAVLRALGVPISTGSHGWVVSAAKSATGSAMLFGGPQVDFNTPELFLEIHLKGGNGFNVMGRAFAGVPFVYAGRTDHMAWAMTSGTFGDTRDTYVETLCDGGTGYLFDGVCTPFESRNEVITVKDSSPVNLTVRRTVPWPCRRHGFRCGFQPEARRLETRDRVSKAVVRHRSRAKSAGVRSSSPSSRGLSQFPLRRSAGQHRLFLLWEDPDSPSRLRPSPSASGYGKRGMDRRVPAHAVVSESLPRLAVELEQQTRSRLPEPGSEKLWQAVAIP
jgi:penicillin G amidase